MRKRPFLGILSSPFGAGIRPNWHTALASRPTVRTGKALPRPWPWHPFGAPTGGAKKMSLTTPFNGGRS